MILTTFNPEFIPILKELKKYDIVSLHPQFTKMLNDADIPAKSLAELSNPIINDASRDLAALTLYNYFNYEFTGKLTGNRHTWLMERMPGYLYSRLNDLTIILSLMDVLNPNLVLVHNDVEPINRALALWAQSRNKPCLHVPHAIYLEHSGRGKIGSDIHDLITANHIAVSGMFQANWYHERGFKKENIFITGLPQFDRVVKQQFTKDQACRILAQAANRPVVTYMSSWRQDTNLLGCHDGMEESYLNFLNSAKELPELQYIIKCHPRGNNVDWHREKAAELGVRCIILKDHLEPVLAASDLVISYGASNVILESAIHPYTRLSILGDKQAMPNDSEIIKLSDENLIEQIKQLLSSAPMDNMKLLQKYHAYVDGNNYLRIAELIKRLHGKS